MQKAYDFKELVELIKEEAKKDGLAIAEEALEKLAKAAYTANKVWLKESAKLSTNKIDDLVMPFIDNLDALVLPQIEKLDLDKDGK